MTGILIFVVGCTVGMIIVTWVTCINDNRAVRLGLWIHEGRAYMLKEVQPNG